MWLYNNKVYSKGVEQVMKHIQKILFILIYSIILITLYKVITTHTTEVEQVQATGQGELITLHTQGEYIQYYYEY